MGSSFSLYEPYQIFKYFLFCHKDSEEEELVPKPVIVPPVAGKDPIETIKDEKVKAQVHHEKSYSWEGSNPSSNPYFSCSKLSLEVSKLDFFYRLYRIRVSQQSFRFKTGDSKSPSV